MSKRFVFYLNGGKRNIVITDYKNEDSLEKTEEKVMECITSLGIVKFKTETDILIVKPTEISAIHIITDVQSNHKNIDTKDKKDDMNLQQIVPEINLDGIEEQPIIDNLSINTDLDLIPEEIDDVKNDKENNEVDTIKIPEGIDNIKEEQIPEQNGENNDKSNN